MLLRLIVLFSLIAAITTVLAAPPRFGFQEPEVGVKFEGGGSPFIDTQPTGTVDASQPTPEPVALPVTPDTDSISHNAAPAVATASAPVSEAKTQSTSRPEKRGFFWLFNRKKEEPEKPMTKEVGAMVATQQYHQSATEKLGVADLHEYRTGYQSHWSSDTAKVMCSITQQIPNYGYVEFRQGVGQPLQFAMYVNQAPAGVGNARVRIQAPVWRHYDQEQDLGVIELESGKRAVAMQADWSNRLMLGLREGMQPVIHYWDAADATSDIEIMLSALNFEKSLDQFQNCLGQVLTYDVEQTSRITLYFNEDSSKLRKQATDKLDEIVEVLKVDQGVKMVNLELYSTSEGLANYNFRLSTRRARAVRDYLMKHGIAEDRILIKIHTKSSSELKKLGYNQTDIHVALKRTAEK
jgi:outer membrane protein OmpA-like peptidoglycan-associated protein